MHICVNSYSLMFVYTYLDWRIDTHVQLVQSEAKRYNKLIILIPFTIINRLERTCMYIRSSQFFHKLIGTSGIP